MEQKDLLDILLSDSNTNVNSMINRRVSLFYRYPLKAFHRTVCPCTLDGVCVVCPGTSELVGQHIQDIFDQICSRDILQAKQKGNIRLV